MEEVTNPGPPWPTIVPLGTFDGLPSFPVEAMPSPLKEYVAVVAEATQTPIDMTAMLTLAVTAAVNSNKYVTRYSAGWYEPLNLYIAVAMPPASRKSAVFAECTAPLQEYEAKMIEESKTEIAIAKSRQIVLEHRKTQLEKKLANETEKAQQAKYQAELESAIEELHVHVVPPTPKLIVDDVTPEKLSNLLCEQNGKIAVMAAEGDLFEIFTGRYSQGQPNIGVLLKAHSGDDLRVDRLGRPSEIVKKPALTIGLAVQPEVLRGLMGKPGLHGKGLLARFLYSLPPSNIGYRDINAPGIPPDLRQEYSQAVNRLLRVPTTGPIDILISRQAGAVFNRFRADVEGKLATFGELGAIQDWAGKLAGAVLRIAGNLHLVENNRTDYNRMPEIGQETIEKAILIGQYLTAHARCAYEMMGVRPQVALAQTIADCIREKQWTQFSKHELHTTLRGRVKSAQELDEPLRILADRGYVRQVGEKQGVGRPSKTFETNPALLGPPAENAFNTQNSPDLEYQPPEKKNDEFEIDFVESGADLLDTVVEPVVETA